MARLIEIYAPEDRLRQLQRCIADASVLWSAKDTPVDGLVHLRVLVAAEGVEAVLDPLEAAFGDLESFRAMVLPIEVAVPRPEPVPAAGATIAEPDAPKIRSRISRHELYEDVNRGAKLSSVYVATVVLSTIVAAVGLVKSSAVSVIAAMVIAPLLGPNTALALAATLADGPLARRALRANVVGVSIAFAVSLAIGAVWKAEVLRQLGVVGSEMLLRTDVKVEDLALALASGAAGALAMTTKVSTSLVGVMVAVALLPPLVVCGMALAAGAAPAAGWALLLLVSNVLCLNLAAIVTFLVQGISPRTWWEGERAKRLRSWVLGGLLLTLVVLVVVVQLLAEGRASGW